MVVMIIVASLLAIAFIVVRVTIGAKGVSGGVVAMLSKAVASLGFIGLGIAGLFGGVSNVQAAAFVVFGLVMGLIGDIVLDLKVIYMGKKEEGIYLTGGMVSFGIGHIFYFVAVCLLLGSSVINGALIGVCLAVAAVVAFAMVFGGEKFMGFKFGNFTIHSIIYAFMLVFMGAFTIGCCIVMQNTKMALFASGMILFLLSDIVLTQMYFGGRPTDKSLCVINHILYYAAQICIAASIFGM